MYIYVYIYICIIGDLKKKYIYIYYIYIYIAFLAAVPHGGGSKEGNPHERAARLLAPQGRQAIGQQGINSYSAQDGTVARARELI